jgi:hypothetical protein
MAYHLAPERAAEVRERLLAGASVRQIVRATNVAKGTIQRMRATLADQIPPCVCGAPGGHKGWCTQRYNHSPARQATVAALNQWPKSMSRWPAKGETGHMEISIKVGVDDEGKSFLSIQARVTSGAEAAKLINLIAANTDGAFGETIVWPENEEEEE